MGSKKKKKISNYKKELSTNIFLCLILCTIIIALGYFILIKVKIKPQINPVTASYISFSNADRTDLLKITNLSKMTDDKGRDDSNQAQVSFKVTGKKNSKYDVVIYPKSEKYDLKNIKYFLCDSNNIELAASNLTSLKETTDGGIIIYQAKINDNNNLNLNMWLTNKYQEKSNDVTFEIKIKLR